MLINCFWFKVLTSLNREERKKTRRNKNNNINGALNITIKRDFVKHKTAKANDTNLTCRSSHDSVIKKKLSDNAN